MAVDIRAEVSCSLGTVISGSFADDYLQGSGLIKTRGEVVLSGTQTPTVGTQVTFTYTKHGSTYTLPRTLRVLSSFADPFRRTTTVQLGCKLTYLDNRKPPVEDPNAKEEHSDVPCSVFLKATLPISAEYVFQQCLDALELTSDTIPLTSKFSVEEFDLTPGYLQVMSDLLQSEGYVGYLDSTETLQFIDLTVDSDTGPVITPADVVDLGPIGVGDLPGESVVVRFDSLRLLPPDELYGDTYLERSWEVEELFGAPSEVSVSYTDDAGEVQSEDDIFYPYSFTATRYDVWDRKIESVSLNVVSAAEINNRWASDAFKAGQSWNAPTGKIFHEIIEYELPAAAQNDVDLLTTINLIGGAGGPNGIKAQLNAFAASHDILANLCQEDMPEGSDVVKAQTTYTYFSEVELAGSLNIDSYLSDGGNLANFSTAALELDSTVVVEYETDDTSGISKTITKRWVSRSQTVSGQQDLATRAQDLNTSDLLFQNSIDSLLLQAKRQVYIGADTGLHTQRQYGLQKRPSEEDRNNTDNEKPVITEQKAEIAWVSGSTTSTAVTEFTVPYAPDDEITWDEVTGEFSSTPSDAEEKALRYGRIQNNLLLGNRSGVSLQLAPELLPKRPFDPIYLEAGGITGAYRVNGTSWAFDGSGIVASTDALLWGAVSAEEGTDLASSWIPLAPGTTNLPLPYTATSGTTDPETGASFSAVITPTTVLPPYIESVLVQGVSRSTAVITDYPYTLDRGSEAVVLRSRAGLAAGSLLEVAPAAFAVTGQAAGYRYIRRLTAAAGSVATSGYGAGSIRDYRIGTNYGTFAATGQNAIVALQRAPLAAGAGSVALSGQDAGYRKGVIMRSDAGAFSLSGHNAGSLRNYVVNGAAGNLSLAGQAAGLVYTAPEFAVLSYTGNGAARSLTGAGFKPGFAWIKTVGVASSNHYVFDKVRGVGLYWSPNANALETNNAATLTSFDADGFSLGNSGSTNTSTYTYKAFCLKEGGASATNNDGAIGSTVSASASGSYSIFTWTGTNAQATIGHGLGATPELVIVKNRTGTSYSAKVGSSVVGNDYYLSLDSTSARASGTGWYRSANTTTVTLGSGLNATGTMVGYAFRSVAGVSKVGGFSGNGSGTLSVDCGFTPRFVLLKAYAGSTSSWFIHYMESGTTGYTRYVLANTTSVSSASSTFQITASGFSVAAGDVGNLTGGTQSAIYMAWA